MSNVDYVVLYLIYLAYYNCMDNYLMKDEIVGIVFKAHRINRTVII